MEKRFKIEFSGKGYPEYRPASVTMRAPSKERAREWADKQLNAWSIDPKAIKIKVDEVGEAPNEEAAEKQAKKDAKKAKKTKKE
jgi:hypothetical protein